MKITPNTSSLTLRRTFWFWLPLAIMWLVMSAGERQTDGSYLGDLFQTAGPVFNATPFTGVTRATVGTMRLAFSDGNNGTLTYIYNGVTVTKPITRQVFSSPVPACS